MVKEPEEVSPALDFDDEEGGGPVKSFLEHLEDLRWTLIKCIVAVLVAMLLCLVAGNKLVALLTWPLKRAERPLVINPEQITVWLGTNYMGKIPRADVPLLSGVTNDQNSLKLVPTQIDSQIVLSFQLDEGLPSNPRPGAPVLKNYTPLGGIIVAMRLAIYGGLILASPFIIYFIGQFVLPALKVREKKLLYQAVAFGSVLFFLGVAFCYFVVSTVALMATVQFSQWMGFAADEWRGEDYIGFMCKFMLGMGIGFEMPVVILTLVRIGLLDYERLVRYRSYAIVGNLILAAFATPSADPITMFLMALPLQFLYEVSTLVAWYWKRRDAKKAAMQGAPA